MGNINESLPGSPLIDVRSQRTKAAQVDHKSTGIPIYRNRLTQQQRKNQEVEEEELRKERKKDR